MAFDVLVAVLGEPLGAAIDDRLGVALRLALTCRVALASVAHVGDRNIRTAVGEQAPERQRVVVILGTVE
jgi:hypothetical protein